MPNLGSSWLSSRFGSASNWLAAAIPSQCWICQRWPSTSLCPDCLARWAQPVHRCQGCALPLPSLATLSTTLCGQCLRNPPLLNACVAAVDYAYPWRSLISDFKFRSNIALAKSFAQVLRQHPLANELIQQCDALVTVPLSAQSLRVRGFDQTQLLGRALAPHKMLSQLVLRRHTEQAQHELTRQQRLRQLQDVFHLNPRKPQLSAQVQGRHILLLDDVMTTGATLNALAATLLNAGALQVSGLVLARTALQ